MVLKAEERTPLAVKAESVISWDTKPACSWAGDIGGTTGIGMLSGTASQSRVSTSSKQLLDSSSLSSECPLESSRESIMSCTMSNEPILQINICHKIIYYTNKILISTTCNWQYIYIFFNFWTLSFYQTLLVNP